MAVNLDAIRARQEALSGNGKGDAYWKPKDGETDIRILQPPGEDPFVDYHLHYNVGNSPGFLCPKRNFGESCPVCDFANDLYNQGGDENIKLAKTLFPRQRYYTAVLVRGESETPKIWSFGKMAYEKLIELFLNPDYGDLSDPETGTDLTIKYGRLPGKRFPDTNITPRRRSSTMLADMTNASDVLEKYPDLSGVHVRKSTEDVKTLLEQFLEGDDKGSESNSSETTQYKGSADDVLSAKLAALVG